MRVIRSTLYSVAAVSAFVAAGCSNPRTEANTAQALNDAANELGALRNDIAQLQTELDSVRITVARQDTIVGKLAAINNIPR